MKILIIDIETTGFLNANGKIVEIGMVELDLKTGARKIVFDKCVRETSMTKRDIERAWIIQNSSLRVSDVMNAVAFDDVKDEVQQIVNSYPAGATAYNKSFDFDFLSSRGINFPKEVDCPMLASTPVCKLPSPRGRGYKWPKVEEAYDYFFPNNNYEEEHRGADDAMHEAEIVYELYKMGKIKV